MGIPTEEPHILAGCSTACMSTPGGFPAKAKSQRASPPVRFSRLLLSLLFLNAAHVGQLLLGPLLRHESGSIASSTIVSMLSNSSQLTYYSCSCQESTTGIQLRAQVAPIMSHGQKTLTYIHPTSLYLQSLKHQVLEPRIPLPRHNGEEWKTTTTNISPLQLPFHSPRLCASTPDITLDRCHGFLGN